MSAVVTQADREVLKAIYAPAAHEAIDAGDYDSHPDARAIARHRSEAVEELVEVLVRACGLVAWIAERASKIDYARYLESEGQEGKIEPEINALVDAMSDGFLASYRDDFEAVLSKHRGEQG